MVTVFVSQRKLCPALTYFLHFFWSDLVHDSGLAPCLLQWGSFVLEVGERKVKGLWDSGAEHFPQYVCGVLYGTISVFPLQIWRWRSCKVRIWFLDPGLSYQSLSDDIPSLQHQKPLMLHSVSLPWSRITSRPCIYAVFLHVIAISASSTVRLSNMFL